MEKQYSLCFEVLRRMQKGGLLDKIMVIGSWHIYFYKDYFAETDYISSIRTRDIDFLVPRRLPLSEEIHTMRNTFFTADTHFNHANIIHFCQRPFADATEMNAALIEKWNARVGKADLVYHLGDLAQGDWSPILEQLNGDIIFQKNNSEI